MAQCSGYNGYRKITESSNVTAERFCPCKQSACPAVDGGSEVTFKPLQLNYCSVNLSAQSTVGWYSRSLREFAFQQTWTLNDTFPFPSLGRSLAPTAPRRFRAAFLGVLEQFGRSRLLGLL
ncbi:hypothetical protein J6590_055650 [Homalodisca vitripennis]|nr:hypothetical protein J6590_055650 [Homalodisca vitripennis]